MSNVKEFCKFIAFIPRFVYPPIQRNAKMPNKKNVFPGYNYIDMASKIASFHNIEHLTFMEFIEGILAKNVMDGKVCFYV